MSRMSSTDMRLLSTALPGVLVVELAPHLDERGFFARTYCSETFRSHGMAATFVQGGLSSTKLRGTIRGLHQQLPPFSEAKLVRCVRGSIFDVAVDLRPGSPTFRRYVSVELTAENRRALYIPEGCAHGFQTLVDDVDVIYDLSAPHSPEHAHGCRFDDPALAIPWPLEPTVVSARDRGWPLLAAVPTEVSS